MDVRCDKCNTEYEFDDARVTAGGVTVQCTQCHHVFQVRKKTNTPPPVAPPPDKPRDWRIRQASGNVFTVRELTTLQRWIVERKVTRADEISHKGETWKRLGDIPDLSAFFQVVDEAQKASELRALHQHLGTPSPTRKEPTPAPVPTRTPAPMTPIASKEPAFVARRTQEFAMGGEADPIPQTVTQPAFESEKQGSSHVWMFAWAVTLVVVGGVAFYVYTNVIAPGQHATTTVQQQVAVAPVAVVDAGVPVPPPVEEKPPPVEAKAEPPPAPPPEVKAPPPVEKPAEKPVVAAKPPPAPKPTKAGPPKDFDYYMSLGDRLRDHEHPEAALDAYAKAMDLKPDRAEPVTGRGLALFDLGKKQEAVSSFQQALELNPRYGVAVMGLAESYRALDLKDDAVKFYEKYLELFPDGPEAMVAKNAVEQLKQ